MKTSAVIVAGGEGKRMGDPKQFMDIAGLPMVIRTLKVFNACRSVDEIVLVVPPDEIKKAKDLVRKHSLKRVVSVVSGGKSRQASTYNGLRCVSSDSSWVLIHDGARPLITERSINDLVAGLKYHDAVILAVPVSDTIKEIKNGGEISRTLDREGLWAAQTPQGFKTSLIKEAHERAKKNGYPATDDSMLIERLGHRVKIVMGSYDNIKLTTPVDVRIAECIIKKREGKRS